MHLSTKTFHLLLLLFLASTGRLQAQSITISPSAGYVTVQTGKTQQYTATVTGLSNTSVNWLAGGVAGGNSVSGTISASGLYTAPANIPAQNPVLIQAVSQANSKVSGSAYINILPAPPVITAVTPNPLAVGSITVTITGTTFQAGASVLETYANGTQVQLSTGTVTSTTVVASGYLGSTPTVSFAVSNPGTGLSNAIVVPVSNGGSGGGGGGGGSPAYALTVNSGSGGGSYTSGAKVNISANAPSPGYQFSAWTGATVASASSSSTTLVMPAANAIVSATYVPVVPTIPYPVSSHPRLWVTPSDVTRLRKWANAANPVYKNGMLPLIQQAYSLYQTQFFPGGNANSNYPDPGDTQGYQGWLTEQVGAILAFNSLIDPSLSLRIQYAQAARNLLMHAINLAALGHLANAPFRDPVFATYNRASNGGEQWPLIVDWIYSATDSAGKPILSAADKLAVRNVFMMWANDCLNASTAGGDHPTPIGVTNSPQLLPGNLPYRMACNNYYLAHARTLTMMALCIDPADDPAVKSTQSPNALGNSLRSYIPNATGAWLYQEFAMLGEASDVPGELGISSNGAGFGLASGGLPPEGMMYGHSYAFILGQLLALQTAGFNSTAFSGPQIGLIGAPVWDRYVKGMLSSLVPAAQIFQQASWLGPVYQLTTYGDLLRTWVTPDFMQSFALLSLLESENAGSAHTDAARWFTVNAVEGGATMLSNRISQPWSYSTTASILYFLLLDPGAAAVPDPRPSLTTRFFDPPAGRMIAHSDWSSSAAMFDYRASWNSINHQLGDGGQFELYRQGEWLTKELSNYDANFVGATTRYHNSLSLQNWCAAGAPNLGWFESPEWLLGSEWILGLNSGDPTTLGSAGSNYVLVDSNLTNLFNRPNIWTPSLSATDITQATRTILWLNGDFTIVYDRATSLHSGLFKQFNLCLQVPPKVSGSVTTDTLPSGQRLYISTLLPQKPTITVSNGLPQLTTVAILEPMQYILTIQDATLPANTRFLNVIQGSNPGGPISPASYVQSTSGTLFDGVIVDGAAIYFPVNPTAAMTQTTFTAPQGTSELFIAGLIPGGKYTKAIQSGNSGYTLKLTPGGNVVADAAGLLVISVP